MAAACQSLQHIFENPLPENPSLLESLSSSWNQIKSPVLKPMEPLSFTEIFGELHFKENNNNSTHHLQSSSSSPSFPISPFSPSSIIDHLSPQNNNTFKLSKNNDDNLTPPRDILLGTPKFVKFANSCQNKSAESSSCFSLNPESLQLCTEGLGFESSDEVEDMKSEMKQDWKKTSKLAEDEKPSNKGVHGTGTATKYAKHTTKENLCGELRRWSRTTTSCGAFPPPISCIGKSGKPWVCFKSYRQDGRFVLKEVRIPTQEFLHACREDGRLKLHFVQPNDEFLEEEEFEEEEEEAEDDGLVEELSTMLKTN